LSAFNLQKLTRCNVGTAEVASDVTAVGAVPEHLAMHSTPRVT